MSALLVLAIRLFRRLRPDGFRTRCLFHESCSRRVEREAIARGFIAAIRVLQIRVAECRSGSVPALDPRGSPSLRLATGRVPDAEEIDPARLNEAFSPMRAWRDGMGYGVRSGS